jgi:hypothetical protein
VPLKLLALALVLAGWFLRRQFVRARQRGFVGSGRQRIDRTAHRTRFHLTLASHALGALICFAAAFFCLTHSIRGF